jgi:hypothetical protein
MDVLRYYTLKEKNDEIIMKKKKIIIKNKDLSLKEKRSQIKKITGRCANCNKPGGTIFEERNGMLKAVCGSKTPCDLNISIKRKLYDNMREVEQKSEKLIESLKMRIIMTKLDYLFGYNNSKDEIVDKFNILKNELASLSESKLINNNKYADIISGIHREPLLMDANNDLALALDELHKLEKTPDTINDQLEQYITIIRPLVEKINQLKYGYYALENDTGVVIKNVKMVVNDIQVEVDDKDIYTLVASPYRFDQLEQERK